MAKTKRKPIDKEHTVDKDIEHLLEPFRSIIKQLAVDLKNDPETKMLEIFETRRSLTRQEYLYKNKRSKTMRSKHLIGLACDFVPHGVDGWSWGDRDVNRSGTTADEKRAFVRMREIVDEKYSKLKFLGEWDMAHIEMR